MYQVIGRRDHLKEQGRGLFEALLGVTIDDSLIGVFTRSLPDGVILERRGQWFESERGELRAVNMLNPGKIRTERGKIVSPFTRAEVTQWMEETKKIAQSLFKD